MTGIFRILLVIVQETRDCGRTNIAVGKFQESVTYLFVVGKKHAKSSPKF